MITPGYHLYRGPDHQWRCAGPDDRFFAVGGPDAVLQRVQRLLHSGDDVARSSTEQPQVIAALDLLARRGIVRTSPVAGSSPDPATTGSTDARSTPPGSAGRPTVRVSGENPIADHVRSLLAPHASVTGGLLDEAAIAGADVVVECAGWLPDARWRSVDAACVHHATPWHMTYLEGDTVVVGPMHLPGTTAGYADVRGRRLAAAPSPRELVALWAYLDGDDPAPPAPWPPPPAAATVAGLVATDVVHILQGRPCPSEGHQLVVDPARAEVRRHRVLPLPSFAAVAALEMPDEPASPGAWRVEEPVDGAAR